MSIELKTRHPLLHGHVELVQTVYLDQNAIDALVFGAVVYHNRSMGYNPTLEELTKLLQGSARSGGFHYDFIEFTDEQVEKSVARLGGELIEFYEKDGDRPGEKIIRPLIKREE